MANQISLGSAQAAVPVPKLRFGSCRYYPRTCGEVTVCYEPDREVNIWDAIIEGMMLSEAMQHPVSMMFNGTVLHIEPTDNREGREHVLYRRWHRTRLVQQELAP